jgi:hypothetical protein
MASLKKLWTNKQMTWKCSMSKWKTNMAWKKTWMVKEMMAAATYRFNIPIFVV